MGQERREEEDQDSWAAQEMLKANLGDKRLNRRVAQVLYQLAQRPEGSVPSAFQSWRETLAAYRLFDNEKVSAEKVLEPHRDATLERAGQFPIVLCVQDTTELDFTGRSQLIERLTGVQASASRQVQKSAFTPRMSLAVRSPG